MPRRTARAALALALLAAAAATAGCGLPEKLKALVAKPTPTPLPAPTPVPAPPLQMTFLGIREERARGEAGPSACALDVQLVGTKRGDVESVRVVVRKADDETGASLVPEGAANAGLEPLRGEDPEAAVVLSIPLKAAARRARTIGEVSGEIELYVPNVDPSAVVVVPRFRAQAGKAVTAPSLAALGVEIAFATPQEAEALPAAADDVVLKVNDPKKAIEGIYFLDADGTAWGTNRETRGGFLVLSSQAEPPGPDWGLKVRLLTPGTLRRYRFALKDVPLP
jgi:hypothetical protein